MLRCRAKRLLSWHYEGENSLAPSTLEWPPTFNQTSIGVNLIGWRQYDCEVQIRVSLGENISIFSFFFGCNNLFVWGFNRNCSCHYKVYKPTFEGCNRKVSNIYARQTLNKLKSSSILVLISDKTVVLIMFYLGHFSLDGTKQSGTSSCSSISSLERVQSFID